MHKLDAYKMDGLGNDFIIFDRRKKSISISKDEIIKISDRENVGCDQVIFIEKDENNDVCLKFFNSDGGEVGACGNGSRCVAYLLMKENLKKKISLKVTGRILKASFDKNNLVSIDMGQPNFDWNKIPLSKKMDNQNLEIKINDKKTIEGFALNVGNPHIIFYVNNLNQYDLKDLGPRIENHEYFPEKCNVTFAKVLNKKNIKVKVWERGAGLTKACGTAACATAVSSSVLKLTERSVSIQFDEGSLEIDWNLNDNIYMSGPVSEVKKIIIDI